MKIVNISQMQKAERDCAGFGTSLDMLMENAGKAVALEIESIFEDIKGKNILVLAGPGNNGGDGLVAARYLHQHGVGVKIHICGSRPQNDPNMTKILENGINYINASNDINFTHLNEWILEADSFFGTGKSRPISGDFATILNCVSSAKKSRTDLSLIALDLPSGLDADTGTVDPNTPSFDYTITLGFPKRGLFNLPGAQKAGNIIVTDIGIPSNLVDYVKCEYLTDRWAKAVLPLRSPFSNKGSFGKVLALAGSLKYTGAAYLACSASMRVGAGLTTLAVEKSLLPILASKMTEITYLPLEDSSSSDKRLIEDNIADYNVFLAGCGIGKDNPVAHLLKSLLFDSRLKLPPTILDADGLNLLAGVPEWWKSYTNNAVLTPHPGEMARLLGKNIDYVQSNRLEVAAEAAAKWNKTVVLKGAYTVISSPDGRLNVSPFANAGLATAGTGDVLAGAIAGMAAQGLPLFETASCGVYLHGLAAEMIKAQIGDAGMIAGDLLPVLPKAIRHLKDL
jgi:hydroxyethylthiazole kinase-like uncharacterized protein yjeF